MIRSIAIAAAALALSAGLVLADPGLRITYRDGVPTVQIDGDYAHSTYTIFRSQRVDGPYNAVTNHDILCLGNCFVEDRSALPGTTYWYRFDLLLPDGSAVSYGPYAVAFSPNHLRTVGARVYPNPMRGSGTVELFFAGEASDASVLADAAVFDAQGRRIRQIHRGPLPRGLTALQWDGRDESGNALRAGFYFLRVSSPLGNGVTRVIRTQ